MSDREEIHRMQDALADKDAQIDALRVEVERLEGSWRDWHQDLERRLTVARAEERETADKVIRNLMAACVTLMDEVVHKKATQWGIVNDAMVAGTAAIRARRDEG